MTQTSEELRKALRRVEELERLEREKSAKKVRVKLDTHLYTITHTHGECLSHFRSGQVHILHITETPPLLTEEEEKLLTSWDKNRSGSYYFEHNMLSMYCGTCLFSPTWRSLANEPSQVEVARLIQLETFLSEQDLSNNWIVVIQL